MNKRTLLLLGGINYHDYPKVAGWCIYIIYISICKHIGHKANASGFDYRGQNIHAGYRAHPFPTPTIETTITLQYIHTIPPAGHRDHAG